MCGLFFLVFSVKSFLKLVFHFVGGRAFHNHVHLFGVNRFAFQKHANHDVHHRAVSAQNFDGFGMSLVQNFGNFLIDFCGDFLAVSMGGLVIAAQENLLGRDYQSTHTYSEEIAAKIDKEVSEILDEAHAKAVEILGTHRAVMDVMVRVLLECETIYTEEVDMIMKGASADEVKNELKERLNAKYEKKQAALKEGNV